MAPQGGTLGGFPEGYFGTKLSQKARHVLRPFLSWGPPSGCSQGADDATRKQPKTTGQKSALHQGRSACACAEACHTSCLVWWWSLSSATIPGRVTCQCKCVSLGPHRPTICKKEDPEDPGRHVFSEGSIRDFVTERLPDQNDQVQIPINTIWELRL